MIDRVEIDLTHGDWHVCFYDTAEKTNESAGLVFQEICHTRQECFDLLRLWADKSPTTYDDWLAHLTARHDGEGASVLHQAEGGGGDGE